jgi:hypothetical protein
MVRIAAILLLVLFISCCGSKEMTSAEREKLTPGLQALVAEESVPDELFDTNVTADGTKEYGVIIRSTNAEELRSHGIKVQSVIGDIITARVSKEQLRSLVALPSVRSVEQGNRNRPHN